MESGPPLSKATRDLLLAISRCPLAQSRLVEESSDHPCSEIVTHRWAQRPHAERVERWRDEHPMPEPWCGHLERAPILFLSSNPGVGKPSATATPTSPLPPLQSRLGRPATYSWEDEDLERWYEDAFEFRIVDGNKKLRADGTPDEHTPYWSSVKKRAEELIPNRVLRPGLDYALSEVVHCKSLSEQGVRAALKVCATRYLLKLLEASAATVIMVMGNPAKRAVIALLKLNPEPRLEGPIRIGARDRFFAFLPHPSAHTFKTLANCYRPEEIEKLRGIAETALSATVVLRPPEPAPPIEPSTPPSPVLQEVPGSKGIRGVWAKVFVVLAVVLLGTWAYRSASHQEQELPAIPKSQASQKCAKCGTVIKPGNQYCINCGAKAEVSK